MFAGVELLWEKKIITLKFKISESLFGTHFNSKFQVKSDLSMLLFKTKLYFGAKAN